LSRGRRRPRSHMSRSDSHRQSLGPKISRKRDTGMFRKICPCNPPFSCPGEFEHVKEMRSKDLKLISSALPFSFNKSTHPVPWIRPFLPASELHDGKVERDASGRQASTEIMRDEHPGHAEGPTRPPSDGGRSDHPPHSSVAFLLVCFCAGLAYMFCTNSLNLILNTS